MSDKSKISWTDATWNPVTGCTEISAGCKNCYAERMAKRLFLMGQPNYKNGFRVTLQPHMLDKPRTWKKPRKIFVNSMSDLFHGEVPFEYIQKVMDVCRETPRHTYQILTKRSMLLYGYDRYIDWPANVWIGVSVENENYKHRIADLKKTHAQNKFVSFEPLLGPIGELILSGIDWVIVGGESGPGARPMDEKWVIEIRDQCIKENVPFFFKQWGGARREGSCLLEGEEWKQFPAGMS